MHRFSRSRSQASTDPARAITPSVILRHSLLELLLTLLLLFGVTTIVRWVVGPSPISSAIPSFEVQLLIVGVAVGVLLCGLIVSPLGRVSGGHINPAITLTMWRFRVFPGVSVVPYILAQLAGSLLGVLAARAVWGPVTDNPPVSDASLSPAPGWSSWAVFPAEAASMAVIVLLVGWFLSVPRLAPLMPAVIGLLVGLGIALLGPITGGCINPARQFGPALVSGHLGFLWVYLLAPMAGALLATALHRRLARQPVLTHRLCGTHADGSPLR
ncbi:MIP/aquaporin family protein [Streptomyces sp. 35G-GA-8]|uniref:MIP/aquaporin family protein n=1 Tax=Streptomyces sp. 35G-GA-8 TaxID=2939434 RepID=UPI00201F2BB1|nr:aquaporin [Streptomyces sp. 35G-GA-8]MCL7377636.1 aquaporin [Streptomyces sp. 35G-GA-8]